MAHEVPILTVEYIKEALNEVFNRNIKVLPSREKPSR